MENLAIGLALVLGSVGSVVGLRPRDGRSSWLAGIPFVEPFVAVILVASMIIGLLMIATYFTTIDDIGMLKGGR